eukprot:gene5629-biopygen2755
MGKTRRRRRAKGKMREKTRNKGKMRRRGRFSRYRTVLDSIHVWEPRGPSPWGGCDSSSLERWGRPAPCDASRTANHPLDVRTRGAAPASRSAAAAGGGRLRRAVAAKAREKTFGLLYKIPFRRRRRREKLVLTPQSGKFEFATAPWHGGETFCLL